MKMSYEDLLSGAPIYISGIGHFRSPMLQELKPSIGIGFEEYNLYINILAWNKAEFIELSKMSNIKAIEKIKNDEKYTIFDIITLVEDTRNLLCKAISFFMCEEIEWIDKQFKFIVKSKKANAEIGKIDRDNFEEVKNIILQLNYIDLSKTAKPINHSSEKSQKMWELAQKYLKKEAKNNSEDKGLSLGNIISKLSASSCGYNLINIYDLTVFQLYDQFFQYGFLKASNINERAFTIHGGDNFDMQAWLKPIFKK